MCPQDVPELVTFDLSAAYAQTGAGLVQILDEAAGLNKVRARLCKGWRRSRTLVLLTPDMRHPHLTH